MDATRFRTEIRIHETASHGRVLEFVLTGVNRHEDSENASLLRSVAKELGKEVSRQQAKTVIINLLGFDYSFGDEVGTLFLSPFMVLRDSGGGRMAIMASGRTAAGLDSLFKAGHLDSVFGFVTHRDLRSALAHLIEIRATEE